MVKEYIEREALVRYTEKQEVIIKDGTSIADAMRIQGNVFRRCVETIPAADVVEVKHGEWENVQDFGNGNCFGYCSVCGTDHKATGIADLMFSFKYCRWCGAKMDGERKEQG